jgi:hypothetical protein
MPYGVRKLPNGKYKAYRKAVDGKPARPLSKHPQTKETANAQIAAIKMHEHDVKSEDPELMFDPSEPRDPSGKWTAGSSGKLSDQKKQEIRMGREASMTPKVKPPSTSISPEKKAELERRKNASNTVAPMTRVNSPIARPSRNINDPSLRGPKGIQDLKPETQRAFGNWLKEGSVGDFTKDYTNFLIGNQMNYSKKLRFEKMSGGKIRVLRHSPEMMFDPNEPRDETGKWTTGGGQGGGGGTPQVKAPSSGISPEKRAAIAARHEASRTTELPQVKPPSAGISPEKKAQLEARRQASQSGKSEFEPKEIQDINPNERKSFLDWSGGNNYVYDKEGMIGKAYRRFKEGKPRDDEADYSELNREQEATRPKLVSPSGYGTNKYIGMPSDIHGRKYESHPSGRPGGIPSWGEEAPSGFGNALNRIAGDKGRSESDKERSDMADKIEEEKISKRIREANQPNIDTPDRHVDTILDPTNTKAQQERSRMEAEVTDRVNKEKSDALDRIISGKGSPGKTSERIAEDARKDAAPKAPRASKAKSTKTTKSSSSSHPMDKLDEQTKSSFYQHMKDNYGFSPSETNKRFNQKHSRDESINELNNFLEDRDIRRSIHGYSKTSKKLQFEKMSSGKIRVIRNSPEMMHGPKNEPRGADGKWIGGKSNKYKVR